MDKALPKFQKAWQVVRRGPPADVLVLRSDLPVPTDVPQGHVLVKVHAAALNAVGYKLMAMIPNILTKRPVAAEYDLAGEVVVSNSTDFTVGDEVFGTILPVPNTTSGALTEYSIVAATQLALKPANVDFITASGMGCVGVTAYEAVVVIAQAQKGQHVFINGGSSSVGGFAVQIAKARGCTVAASCSARNIQYVKSLGADEVFDYTARPLHEQLMDSRKLSPPFDVIVDAVSATAPLFAHSASYLAPSGIFLSTGPDWEKLPWGLLPLFYALRPVWLGGTNRKFKIFFAKDAKPGLQAVAELVAAGQVKPQVDSVFAFPDALKAYERLMSNRAKGKVVVRVP